MSDYNRVTLLAFMHHPEQGVFDSIRFLEKEGGKFEKKPSDAEVVRFHGKLNPEDVATINEWCHGKSEQGSGYGYIVFIVGNAEPQKFEWHQANDETHHFARETVESMEAFMAEFHHLMHT